MRFRKPEDVLLNSFSPTKLKFSGQQIRNNSNKLIFFQLKVCVYHIKGTGGAPN